MLRSIVRLTPALQPCVAAAYAVHWRERLAVSVRLDSREDWRTERRWLTAR